MERRQGKGSGMNGLVRVRTRAGLVKELAVDSNDSCLRRRILKERPDSVQLKTVNFTRRHAQTQSASQACFPVSRILTKSLHLKRSKLSPSCSSSPNSSASLGCRLNMAELSFCSGIAHCCGLYAFRSLFLSFCRLGKTMSGLLDGRGAIPCPGGVDGRGSGLRAIPPKRGALDWAGPSSGADVVASAVQ